MGEQAARQGSEMNELVSIVVDGVKAIADRNPEFMKSIVVPLVEAGRQVLAEAESSDEAAGEAD
jgi:hypothetical protein